MTRQNARPFFSVIVPTRNRVEYLDKCLQSIANQRFDDYEVLVVDDGSNAEIRSSCRSMAKRYGQRFHYIEHNPAGAAGVGPSAIRNVGLSRAEGSHIAFCDDDDYWSRPDHLEIAAKALKESGADLYFSNQQAIAPNGEVLVETLMQNLAGLVPSRPKILERVHRIGTDDALSYPDYAHLNITILSRRLLDRIGGFWECTNYAEDVHFFVRACDRADGILYRSETCAIHNVPAKRAVADSVSTRFGHWDKRMLEAMVYQHLLCIVDHPAALRYARLSLNNLQKTIASELEGDGRKRAAAIYAANALATLPRLKWGVKAGWMGLTSLRSK